MCDEETILHSQPLDHDYASRCHPSISDPSFKHQELEAPSSASSRYMLPFLAASGHNNYTKSLVLFFEKMEKLEETHPAVYRKFLEGLFVIHRSDSYWFGIFSDLCIKQVLMGNIKSVGGPTRERGFQESTSLLWLLSMPACGEVHKALQELTVLSRTDGDTIHIDLSQLRLRRDAKDIQSLTIY